MEEVKSFDIFNTLLARKVKSPTDIFEIIEKNLSYNNFKKIRIEAQNNSNNTIESIYLNFKKITGETDENINKLRETELKVEILNTIPIMSNILKIKDGDILVADTHFTYDEIMKLLKYHNINTNINLYVSSGGKLDGSMWEDLIKKHKIISHTSNNYYSDIIVASKYNINGIYTKIHEFTFLESYLIDNRNFELCYSFRKIRLMNPYDEFTMEYKIYDQQIQYNIPMLLFMCKRIAEILKKENKSKVLFFSREGSLIIKLFSFLYPQFKSDCLYSSKFMNNYNLDYISYIKKIYNKDECIIIDLCNSFESCKKIFMEIFRHLPTIFNFEEITNNSNKIELFNQDWKGTLIGFKNDTPINFPTQTKMKYIKIMHDTVEKFINTVDTQIILNEIFDSEAFWKSYYKNIVLSCENILTKNNNIQTLTYLANKYNSDKGNVYKCAHYYTIIYQEIISNILDYNISKNKTDDIDFLEIGLNRDNTSSIPSLILWNKYFNKNINITGFDIQPDFLKFNSLYDNINIVIGDQSNVTHLQQLQNKQYDIIIDDGYHASKHQQITFKTLWSNVKSGGYFIIEDLHYQPTPETCIKTRNLLENWKNNNWISSEYISNEEIQKIKPEIESINFYDSQSKLWGNNAKNAFVYLKKK